MKMCSSLITINPPISASPSALIQKHFNFLRYLFGGGGGGGEGSCFKT